MIGDASLGNLSAKLASLSDSWSHMVPAHESTQSVSSIPLTNDTHGWVSGDLQARSVEAGEDAELANLEIMARCEE